jgi:hypothetical protein
MEPKSSPWRQPIVWLMVALVGAAIVGSVWLLKVAANGDSVDVVPDEVQRTGQAQQADFGPDATAAERKLGAIVRIEPAQGSPLALKDAPLEVAVPAGAVVSQAIEVGAPAGLRGRHALVFVVEADDGSASARVDSTFFGPM